LPLQAFLATGAGALEYVRSVWTRLAFHELINHATVSRHFLWRSKTFTIKNFSTHERSNIDRLMPIRVNVFLIVKKPEKSNRGELYRIRSTSECDCRCSSYEQRVSRAAARAPHLASEHNGSDCSIDLSCLRPALLNLFRIAVIIEKN
jgi:hypothetical protein